MKRPYETPILIVHGRIEEMTRYSGSSSASDSFIIGPFSFDLGPLGFSGSQDLIVPLPSR
jgi:hypothetical protein